MNDKTKAKKNSNNNKNSRKMSWKIAQPYCVVCAFDFILRIQMTHIVFGKYRKYLPPDCQLPPTEIRQSKPNIPCPSSFSTPADLFLGVSLLSTNQRKEIKNMLTPLIVKMNKIKTRKIYIFCCANEQSSHYHNETFNASANRLIRLSVLFLQHLIVRSD